MTNSQLLIVALPLVPAALVLVNQWGRHRRWGRGVSRALQSWLIVVIAVQSLVHVGPAAILGGAGPGASALRFALSPDAILRLFLFALWLAIASRLFVAIRAPDESADAPRGPRTATLQSRAGSNAVCRAAWTFVFAIWAYGAAIVATALALRGWGASSSSVLVSVALTILSLALAARAPAAVRDVESEPEPMDPFASQRLASEYAVQRQARCTGYYWLTLAIVTWIALAVPAALASRGVEPSLTYALEASAFVIGIIGSAFGLRLVQGMSRIRKLRDELSAEAIAA
jgi:hypothetical protein